MNGLESIIIPIFAITAIFILPIVCITILIAMKHRRGGMREKDRAQWNEETRIMQELNEDVTRMEARIEALETILMERYRKDK
jgi:phage shock protein B